MIAYLSTMDSFVPIKVLCRIRPLNPQECYTEFLPVLYDDNVSISLSGRVFTFDRVFGPDTTQHEIYENGAAAIVKDVLSGYNGTIFAYGQTSSGKTYTIDGDSYSEESQGITQRVISDIYSYTDGLQAHIDVEIKLSYYEVYMDKVRDLLDVTKTNLPVHEDINKVPYVKGVTEKFVTSIEQVSLILEEGKSNRKVAVTNMNEHSSRSHSVLHLRIKQYNSQTETAIIGQLYLVDLAGSEKVNRSGVEGVTLDEAKKINKSLSALGNVISALADGHKNHVPYRDSKLTRILQQSLGGNSRTAIFICCSPSNMNEAQTKSTLLFGQRAKTIKNRIKINEELPADEWKKRYEKEKEKTANLRKKLAELEIGNLQPSRSSTQVSIGNSSLNQKNNTASSSSTPNLTSYTSMPSLLSKSTESDGTCEECLQYQQEISKLYQQLDDKDDELDERSREILSFESRLREQKHIEETLKQNNSILVQEYKDLEQKYRDAQEEVRTVLSALEELAMTYQDKDLQSSHYITEIDNLRLSKSHLERQLERAKTELALVRDSYDSNRQQTLDMIIELYNDLQHKTGNIGYHQPPKSLRRGLDHFKSSPDLTNDDEMSTSYTTMSSSFSAHDNLSNIDQASFYSLPRDTKLSGNPEFQSKVSELKSKLSDVLEKDFNIITETGTSTRSISLRRGKPKTGRVFTVLARAGRSGGILDNNIIPIRLGRF